MGWGRRGGARRAWGAVPWAGLREAGQGEEYVGVDLWERAGGRRTVRQGWGSSWGAPARGVSAASEKELGTSSGNEREGAGKEQGRAGGNVAEKELCEEQGGPEEV